MATATKVDPEALDFDSLNLFEKVQVLTNAGVSRNEICHQLGYTSIDKNGKTRFNFSQLTADILQAQGLSFQAKVGEPGQRGRSLSFKATTGAKTGIAQIGAGYMKLINVEPGGTVEIEHDPENECLVLRRAD